MVENQNRDTVSDIERLFHSLLCFIGVVEAIFCLFICCISKLIITDNTKIRSRHFSSSFGG